MDDMNLGKGTSGGKVEVDADCLPVAAEETNLRRLDDGPSLTEWRDEARIGGGIRQNRVSG